MKDNLPNFFIVGTVKGGTTSMYEYLKRHPDVFMPVRKEPHFYSNLRPSARHVGQCISDQAEYISLFQGSSNFRAIGEASTSYLWEEGAPYRIKSAVPNAKIIIMLRDPIERAFSHYLMDVRDGLQHLSFYDALINDYSSSKKGYFISHLYVELGMYFKQVKRYMDVFGLENILIISFDDFKRDARMILARVACFLGIDSKMVDFEGYEVHNAYAAPRNRISQLLLSNRTAKKVVKTLLPHFSLEFLKNSVLYGNTKPQIDARAVNYLRKFYDNDMRELNELLGWAPYRFDSPNTL